MNLLYKICRILSLYYYRLFFKLEVEGLEHIDKKQNYVIVANHIHFQDPLVLGGVLPIVMRFMGKKELFKNPIVGGFLRKVGVFPVDRESNDLKAIKIALTILKEKQSLGLFPEGTRNVGFEPLKVKGGTAMLAIKTETPVLPITVDSFYKLGGPLRIAIHKPISLDDYYGKKHDADIYEELSQKIIDDIYSDLKVYKRHEEIA